MKEAKRIKRTLNDVKIEGNEIGLQCLPLEMATSILKWLSAREMYKMRSECSLLRRAVAMNLRDRLAAVRRSIRKSINRTFQLVKYFRENNNIVRYDLVKSLMTYCYIESEILLLYVLIWRYTYDLHAWLCLAPFVASIVDELDTEITYAFSKGDIFIDVRSGHPHLDSFFQNFEDDIEPQLPPSKATCPFALKMIDLLTVCPSANFQICFEKNLKSAKVRRVSLFFQLRNVEMYHTPNLDVYEDSYSKEKAIIKHMRHCIRQINLLGLKNSLNAVKEVYDTHFKTIIYNRRSGKKMKYTSIERSYSLVKFSKTESNQVELTMFIKRSSYDTEKSGLTCVIEACCDEMQPLNYEALDEVSVLSQSNFKSPFTKFRGRKNTAMRFKVNITSDVSIANRVREISWYYVPKANYYSHRVTRHQLKRYKYLTHLNLSDRKDINK